MSIFKAKEPLVPKEAISPAIVVTATTNPLAPGSFTQNRAQTSTNPAVYGGKGPSVAVFEVCFHRKPCGIQGVGPVDLINQTEPYASFHPLVEGLQHAVCPYGAFHPVPLCGLSFSRLFSLCRHCHGFPFVLHSPSTSTFLHPFAPRALPRFHANMDALTPARLALRTLIRGNEHQPFFSGQVSLVHSTHTSMHSVSNHLTRPTIAFMLPAQRDGLPGLALMGSPGQSRSGLRHFLGDSSLRPAESSSSSYGLHVRLGLLSTPPHGDAVTFGYRERASPGKGLSPFGVRWLPGAPGAASSRDVPPPRS